MHPAAFEGALRTATNIVSESVVRRGSGFVYPLIQRAISKDPVLCVTLATALKRRTALTNLSTKKETKSFSVTQIAAVQLAFKCAFIQARAKKWKRTPLFERTSLDSLIKLSYLIEQRSYCAQQFPEMTKELLEADLSSPFFQRDNWLLDALILYDAGAINDMAFSAACHLDLFLYHYPKNRVYSLDDPIVRSSILSCLDRKAHLTLFNDLSSLEKLVFVAPIPADKKTEKYEYSVYKEMQWKPFLCKEGYIVLSISAMQRIIDTMNPSSRLLLFPTFGYSTQMKHFLGIPHKRTCAISSRFLPSISRVHHHKSASPFSFSFHDMGFHAYMVSFNPYRDLEESLATLLYSKDPSLHRKSIVYLLDRPFPYDQIGNPRFSFFSQLEPHHLFWIVMAILLYRSKAEKPLLAVMKEWYHTHISMHMPIEIIKETLSLCQTSTRFQGLTPYFNTLIEVFQS